MKVAEKPTIQKKRPNLYKIINKIIRTNVPNNGILIAADARSRSKHGRRFRIMENKTTEHKYLYFP